jgi:flagellar basal body rod protein FlgB
MESLSGKKTNGMDMKKKNEKGEEIILQKATHHTTRNGNTVNPNKKRAKICKNLKISVMGMVCMVIGLALVAC